MIRIGHLLLAARKKAKIYHTHIHTNKTEIKIAKRVEWPTQIAMATAHAMLIRMKLWQIVHKTRTP